MVKIKTKKTMNLPQLIEWAMLPESNVCFEKYETENMTVTFSEIGTPHIETKFHFLPVDEIFTVEEETEITEYTVIPKLMTTFKKTCLKDDFGYQRVRIDENYSIKLMLNRAE